MQTQRQRNREDPEASDGVLVQQALGGDQEAFESLVSRYQQPLFGLIYHYVGSITKQRMSYNRSGFNSTCL